MLGFGGVLHLSAAALVLGAGASAVWRDTRVLSLLCLAGAGVLMAVAARSAATRCAHGRGAIVAVFSEGLSSGAFARGETIAIGRERCALPITVAVKQGRVPAGRQASVTGVVAVDKGRVFVRHAAVRALRERDAWIGMRARLGRGIDSAFGARAGLVRALLLADTRSLDVALRDRFAEAGLVHMLSISGLHVAIIAAAVELLGVAARLSRRTATLATMAIIAAYLCVIGAPAPAVRSAVMLAIAGAGRLGQRNVSPWAALALGGGVPLFLSPRTVLDLGWQLSVLGMMGLIASSALVRRWLQPRVDGLRRTLASGLLASVIASLVTGPLVAWHFGRLSVVAPLANLVATPIVALLQPMLFLALAATPLPAVERFIADASMPLLWALDYVATAASAVPMAAIDLAPTFGAAVLAFVAATAVVVACVSRYPARAGITAITSAAAVAWWPMVPRLSSGDGVELHMIDVGQGDATAIRTPRGRWILIDAGRVWRGGDAGRSTIIPYLRRRGGDVAAFILTHPHADHAGGAATIVRALRPRVFWDGAYLGTSDSYRTVLESLRERATPWRRVRPGLIERVDDVALEFLAPDSAWTAHLDDPNEASVVVRVRYGSVRFLLVGDAERDEERWLLMRDSLALRADVLKVGHHGSSTSTTPDFLRAVRPSLALVSVGRGNSYRHPSPRVMGALVTQGATVLRTDQVGHVIVRSDGEIIEMEAQGERWVLSPRSATP